MLDHQNNRDFSRPGLPAAQLRHQDGPNTQDASPGGQGGTVWLTHRDRAGRLNYRDYYWMMSLADYLEWIQKEDGSEPPISFSKT